MREKFFFEVDDSPATYRDDHNFDLRARLTMCVNGRSAGTHGYTVGFFRSRQEAEAVQKLFDNLDNEHGVTLERLIKAAQLYGAHHPKGDR